MHLLMIFAALIVALGSAVAQDYPTRPINIIVQASDQSGCDWCLGRKTLRREAGLECGRVGTVGAKTNVTKALGREGLSGFHVSDDRLAALVHMNMFNPHKLRAAVSERRRASTWVACVSAQKSGGGRCHCGNASIGAVAPADPAKDSGSTVVSNRIGR